MSETVIADCHVSDKNDQHLLVSFWKISIDDFFFILATDIPTARFKIFHWVKTRMKKVLDVSVTKQKRRIFKNSYLKRKATTLAAN